MLDGNRAIEGLTRERDAAVRGGGERREGEREEMRRREGERERDERERLEERVREQASELKELRETVKRRKVDEWDGEDGRVRGPFQLGYGG